MENLIEVKDKFNKIIYLSKERWKHINEDHPEIAGYLKWFELVLKNPTKVASNSLDAKVKYFYRYLKDEKKYLLIIVKYLNGKGFIISSYLIRKIQ
ncbi:MAG: hypothetical protein Q8R00_04920 [Candidatus Nanoarchaeia archaeon]|nr:hypothetical protein [Candidatus Nanoarchaeia archaeon]